jgi:DtxR family Mn-dependent transcriptional regulator
MTIRTSSAGEDYLKTIYELTRSGERASTQAIADQLGVTPASATGMVQKLAREHPPLVKYEKNHGTALTPAGEKVALEVIRHHRLIETYLLEKLNYTWDQVHEEADRLEHVISEQMEERMAQSLGDPQYDPHGEPIPNREFHLPEQYDMPMGDLHPGDRATVVRIAAGEPELLRYLASIGLSLGNIVEVTNISPFDGNITLKINGKDSPLTLGQRVTGKIFVKKTLPPPM